MDSVERKFGVLMAKIMQGCEANREVILKFLNFLEGRGYSCNYRRGYAQALYLFDKFIGGKSFHDAAEDEVLGFLRELKPLAGPRMALV